MDDRLIEVSRGVDRVLYGVQYGFVKVSYTTKKYMEMHGLTKIAVANLFAVLAKPLPQKFMPIRECKRTTYYYIRPFSSSVSIINCSTYPTSS